MSPSSFLRPPRRAMCVILVCAITTAFVPTAILLTATLTK